MAGIWQVNGERLDKYLVIRRDNTVPPWPWFVFAAADPIAPVALRAYADAAREYGMDPAFVDDVNALADEFDQWRTNHDTGDPDGSQHRVDDPTVVARLDERRSQ